MSSDDFIPLTTAPTTPPPGSDSADPLTTPNALASNLAERLKMARLSMEGPERAIVRERNEKETRIETETKKLEGELAFVVKHKEDLEIAWVVLDNKRNDFKKLLAPILAEEEKTELKEGELESREQTTMLPSDRQKIEKERWQTQENRRQIEVKKWELEDKIAFMENQLKENTDRYQELLNQEEVIRKGLDNLEEELSILSEQERIEAEDKTRRALIEAEMRQKAAVAKINLDQQNPPPKIETPKIETPAVKTPTPTTPPTPNREALMREAEDNRRKMQEEIARITSNLPKEESGVTPPSTLSPAGPQSLADMMSTHQEPKIKPSAPEPVSDKTPGGEGMVIPPSPETPVKINVIKKAEETSEKNTAIETPSLPKTPAETPTAIEDKSLTTSAEDNPTTPVYREPINPDDLIRKERSAVSLPTADSFDGSSLQSIRTLKSDLDRLKNQPEK